ncbi:MAG: F0F1 ATP synthase subunit A [Candidatus Limivicinus sp.]|jgi:F-type H+-transporting ATPase subunit a
MAEDVLFTIGPVEVTGVVVTSWVIIALLALFSYLATRRLKEIPGPLQTAAEMAIGSLRKFFADVLGKRKADRYLPIFATFFIYIIVSNYSGLLPGAGHLKGFSVPTGNLSVTAGLAITAFFAWHYIGVKELGAKAYFGKFFKPFALMIVINLLEQIIRPLSLALRLYGNLFGEEAVTENLYEVFPIGLPIVMNILSLLFCFIQALVFTMLLSVYVDEGTEISED